MLVGIYDLRDYNDQELGVLQTYEKILSRNDIRFFRLEASQPDFWERVASLDLLIFRWGHYDSDHQKAHDILQVVERALGVKCYPNWQTSWHYDDKVKQYLLMKAHGLPMVESHIFWERKAALDWTEDTTYPVVFKLRNGAGSKNVVLVRTRKQAQRLVKRMFGRGIYPGRGLGMDNLRVKHFSAYRELHHVAGNLYRWTKGLDVSPHWRVQKNYALFQKFLPGNDLDTRITVIGDRAFSFRRMVRRNDFRASGSGMIDYDTGKIDIRCVETAFRVSKKLGFQSMAYDFLFTEDREPQFCEISYTYLSVAIQKCPGYWDPELNWHDGHFWPEYLHLVDALGLPNLKPANLER